MDHLTLRKTTRNDLVRPNPDCLISSCSHSAAYQTIKTSPKTPNPIIKLHNTHRNDWVRPNPNCLISSCKQPAAVAMALKGQLEGRRMYIICESLHDALYYVFSCL